MTKMKFQFFYKEWHIYFAFLGLSLIVNSPLIYGYSVMQQGQVVALVKALSFSTSIMVLPIFIGNKTVTKLYLYLLSLFVFVIPLHLLYIYLYHTTQFTPDDIAIMMETDLPEAMGFLRGYGLYVLSTLLLLLLLYRWVLKTILPYRFSTAQRVAALTLLVAFWGVIFLRSDKASLTAFAQRLENAHPTINFFLLGQQAYQEYGKIAAYQATTKNFTFHAQKKDALAQREIYVLIIGESARYANWEINGYNRATTPRLKKIENLVSYSDVAAGGPITRIAVPLMITQASADHLSKAFEEKSIVWAFKESGFRTYWVGNQWQLGQYSTFTTMYAKDADQTVFLRKSIADRVFDEAMIPVFASIIRQHEERKIFIVLHMYGSHWRYEERYPENFDLFQPSMTTDHTIRMNDHSQKTRMINSYDNTILYADYFISSIINVLAQSNAVSALVFMSDHGEDLFDDDRLLFMHGNPSKFSFHVPLLIWTSDLYNSTYPVKQQNIIANRNAKIRSHNLFDSLLDMANITYANADPTKSVASSSLKFYKRTVLIRSSNPADYDDLH